MKNQNLNSNNINDSNIIETIKFLIEKEDIKSIAKIMSDYNNNVSPEKHQEATNIINNSIHKDDINNLICAMLGIYR
jgi:hypothetical protein